MVLYTWTSLNRIETWAKGGMGTSKVVSRSWEELENKEECEKWAGGGKRGLKKKGGKPTLAQVSTQLRKCSA